MDKSNATFDNTLSSTFDTTEVGSNSTKVDESTVYEDDNDNDDAEVESDTKDEPAAETTVADNDIVTESTETNNSNNMVSKWNEFSRHDFCVAPPAPNAV